MNDEFRDKVRAMRSKQKEYFATRNREVLQEARSLERQVDLMLDPPPPPAPDLFQETPDGK